MARSWLRPLVLAPLWAVALGPVSGCSNPAGPAPGACTRETVLNTLTPIPASTHIVQSLTTNKTGRLNVTVDWKLDVNVMSAVLAQGPCTLDQFSANECNVIVDLFSPPKPLEDSTTWLRPGGYDLILGNFGLVPDTVAINVTLSSAGCPTP